MTNFAIYLTSDIAEICDIDQKKDELCFRYQLENYIFSLWLYHHPFSVCVSAFLTYLPLHSEKFAVFPNY